MTVHDFATSLAFSQSQSDAPWWREVYQRAFPSMVEMVQVRNDGWAQRGGIDRHVILASGKHYTIDEKVRAEDHDDILLEYWSDEERAIKGWVAKDLACDFIAYAFVPSRRCYLLPFATLRLAYRRNGIDWIKAGRERRGGFKEVRAENRRYVTVSVAVPIDVLMAALKDAMLIYWTATEG